MRYYIYALFVLLLDQVTKWAIVKNLMLGESRPVIGEFFQITSHRNRGAAFGILQDQRWFFIVITLVVVSGIVWYLRKTFREGRKLLPFALSLLLGGAIGNFVDRALFGEVVDFLQFRFQFNWFGSPVDYTYPIFNIADSAIVVGVILIFVDSLITWRNEKRGA
ncbi:signal peptidase II [Paenibacillus radicis (ex Xue et al. 2023)]|uniref:Lipoprotein signal peptidase n=1 Tax=Paenibacillus radicis (ex Xue et al. 2023) TaxID=2972489 RepID=A0ABT1YP35_9BACL|nr:signal peptidase II [Paenibacillus radicis (ex Xue et al. 2023)]MCR8634945.1 signal peptidase II [Paenibacillus radicis (ex Xue et al. 2023)]